MPGQASWHDFFLGVASAGAALTGLVFVAISLHPKEIAAEPVLRTRARGALAGFAGAMFVGLVALLPEQVERAAQGILGFFALLGLASVVQLQLRHVHHDIGTTAFNRWFLMATGYSLVAAAALGLAAGGPNAATWLYVLLAGACFLFLGTAIWQCWLLVLQIEEPSDVRLGN